ncbi:MAG: SAP domain-containing protein, partial [Candidatus Thermoplasmatota archaeon]|nr:SAP domain-containing protein [Candidatus Thermoplasmatota archaeon]
MASEGPPDRATLSAMKVSELRQLCSDRGLLVSGKKDELVDRMLGIETLPEEAPKPSEEPTEDIDDAIDKLIARVSGEGPDELESEPESEPEPEEEPLEAEIVEAELVEPEPEGPEPEPEEEPETVEEDPWFSGVIPSETSDELLLDDVEEEEPSMVIVLPSVEGLKENWRPISAIAVVVLLVGAAAFYLIQQDPAFTARPLRYGDHMDFTVTETTIEVTGDEMIALLRDVTTPTLNEVCDELRATVSGGTGSNTIRNGGIGDISHPLDAELIGAVNAHDSYGREHLTVEQTVTHDLAI